MAELVSALLSKVVDLGVGEAQRHVSAVCSVKGELRKLENELKVIQPIVEDAHNKQFTSRHIKDWISRVNHIIYDAEDIIDLYKAKTGEVDAQTSLEKVRKQLSSLSFSCRNLSFLHKIANEIKEVTERLNSVYKEKDDYGLVPITAGPRHPQDQIELLCRNRLTTSNITEQKSFGREKDEDSIVKWLKNSHNSKAEEGTSVMAIVGMGGLGKTTLAKKIYHNSSIKGYFEKLIWICASERPQLRELFKRILEGLGGKGSGANELMELDALNLEIAKHLKEKRFLLVIDDTWDYGWWSELNGLLQQGAQGSRVLITTRKEEVAVKMDAAYLHRLMCLTYDESWSLFVTKVLRRNETVEELDRVKDFGRVVVERCKGLPLALSVAGSMLKHKPRRKADWQKVADSPFWAWEGNIVGHDENKQILSTIALSYMNLPFPLKQCLTYCSIYPKNFLMDKEKLMWLWVAEGFIPEVEGEEMETCAHNCLDTLVGCSLIQQDELEWYTLHDIVHDFASYVRGNENANLSLSTGTDSSLARALCLTDSSNSTINGINQHTRFRTLVTMGRYFDERRLPAGILLNLKWLRVLDLSGTLFLNEFPGCLGDLVLLKHLNLSSTLIIALPESISKLRSLETLNLKGTFINILPQHTSNLRALRRLHLDDEKYHTLECMPRKIGRLTLLRTLDYFVVGSGTRECSGCSIRELHHMNNLEGSLCIDHIERIQTREEAKDAELHKKAKLQTLKLHCHFRHELNKRIADKMEGIFEELQPPKGLKTLDVFCYGGIRFPGWLRSLSCLERVSINGCNLLKELPMLAHLPNLEVLEIKNMESLEEWSFNTHEEPMPCLRSLTIAKCRKLRALPVGFAKLESLDIGNMESLEELLQAELIPNLQSLCFDNCPKLRAIAIGFPKLRQLQINRMISLEEWTQIETLPCLQSLEIRDCPKLRAIPEGLRPTELHELKLRSLPELGLTPLASIENLRELELGGLPKVDLQEHMFLQMLKTATTLKRLDLDGFSNLGMESQMVEEVIDNMNQLEHLSLRNCSNLAVSVATVLRHHHLPKLEKLEIFYGNGFRFDFSTPKLMLKLDIESVDALSGFRNWGSRIGELAIRLKGEVDSVPEWVQYLQSIEVLGIVDSPKLTHLPEWLGEFPQLRRLELSLLPELGGLPDGMQFLTQLQILSMNNLSGLTHLPEWLSEFSQLRNLKLNGLPLLRSLPDGMALSPNFKIS